MGNSYFRFKNFTIRQENVALKVGTDGVLLGAWAALTGTEERILDVGTGTGVIALMLAQRHAMARIDALDVDAASVAQARANVATSPWSDRVQVYHTSFQEFSKNEQQPPYDVIVSNPPYFIGSLQNPEQRRAAARHAELLPQAELAAGAARLLTKNGRFFAIFPYQEGNTFIAEAAAVGLYCTRKLSVFSAPGKPVKRVILAFDRERKPLCETELLISGGTDSGFTPEYQALTSAFYLNF